MKRVWTLLYMMVLAVCLSSCTGSSQEAEVVLNQNAGVQADEQSMAAYFTANTKIEDVINDPVFGDYGRLIFPVDSGYYGGSTLGNLSLAWYNYMEKYPLIGYPEEEAPFVYERAKELGIHFNQSMTVDNDYGNLSMISQNLGFGIYPRMIAENCQFPVKAIPTDFGSSTPISIGIRSYEKGSLAAKAFVDYVLENYLSEDEKINTVAEKVLKKHMSAFKELAK